MWPDPFRTCTYHLEIVSAMLQVIVVTWARGICLISMPEARGPQTQGMVSVINIVL